MSADVANQREHALQLVERLVIHLERTSGMALTDEAKLELAASFDLCEELKRLLTQDDSRASPSKQPQVQSAAVTSTAKNPQKTVVIIDDDEDMQKTLRFLLPKKGNFNVLSVIDPRQAVAFLKVQPADVVLMDLMMPHITGFELLAQLRAIPELAKLKIIIGSSRSYDKDRIAVLKVGADDFIAKPYNFPELILRLKNLAG